jgi:hypothetical protein
MEYQKEAVKNRNGSERKTNKRKVQYKGGIGEK